MDQPNSDTNKIILDTCIVQYILSKDIGQQLVKYLITIKDKHFEFAISQISIYEQLQGLTETKEIESLSLVNALNSYLIDTHTLITAAKLKTLYDMEKIPTQQISDGDKLIAATSILTGSPIMTANVNDFPRPFFTELERVNISYIHKNTSRMIPVYILIPNLELINNRFATRPKN